MAPTSALMLESMAFADSKFLSTNMLSFGQPQSSVTPDASPEDKILDSMAVPESQATLNEALSGAAKQVSLCHDYFAAAQGHLESLPSAPSKRLDEFSPLHKKFQEISKSAKTCAGDLAGGFVECNVDSRKRIKSVLITRKGIRGEECDEFRGA